MDANYRKLRSFTTFADRVVGKEETLGTATPPPLTDFAQMGVPASERDLYQASAFCGMLKTNFSRSNCGAIVAAMALPDEQRRHSPLRRLLKSLVEVPSVLWPFGSLAPLFPQTIDRCVLEGVRL